jgi:hypothetical protein
MSKVAEFIDPISSLWDEMLVRSLFYTADVNHILQIPLNTHGFDDFISWNYTKHGRFTVRLAYHLQWKNKFGPLNQHNIHPKNTSGNYAPPQIDFPQLSSLRRAAPIPAAHSLQTPIPAPNRLGGPDRRRPAP